MSFSFEFYSKQVDSAAIIAEQTAPESVKAFLLQSITAFRPDTLIRVKAVGHLYNGDYQQSNADIHVQEIPIRVPRTP